MLTTDVWLTTDGGSPSGELKTEKERKNGRHNKDLYMKREKYRETERVRNHK